MVDDEEPDPDEPFNFKIWSEAPPEIEDPFALSGGRLPMVIEPEEAIVPEHGTATFTVTMTCMKATLTAANNYRYTLIGDCALGSTFYVHFQQLHSHFNLACFFSPCFR